jgi:hypothetical protein
MQITAIPPTTPPTIGPVLLCLGPNSGTYSVGTRLMSAAAEGTSVVGDGAGEAESFVAGDENVDEDVEVTVDGRTEVETA